MNKTFPTLLLCLLCLALGCFFGYLLRGPAELPISVSEGIIPGSSQRATPSLQAVPNQTPGRNLATNPAGRQLPTRPTSLLQQRFDKVLELLQAGDNSIYPELIAAALETQEPHMESNLLQTLQAMPTEEGANTFALLQSLLEHRPRGAEELNMNRLFHVLWQRWGKVDLPSALAKGQTSGANYSDKGCLMKYIYEGWGKDDPAASLAKLMSDNSLPDRDKGVEGIMDRWSEVDLGAAQTWALKNLSGGDQAHAIATSQWASVRVGGGQAAVQAWKSLPQELQRSSFDALVTAMSAVPTVSAAEMTELAQAGRAAGLEHGKLGKYLAPVEPDSPRLP